MKIAFDGKRFYHNHTGLGNYSRTLIRDYSEYFPANKTYLLASKTHKSSFQNPSNSSLIDPKPSLNSYWRSYSIHKDINKIKPDIYHGLSNELPLSSSKIKALKIVTIHDLFYEKFPSDFSYLDRKMYQYKTRKACENADHIIAISEATKVDIIDFLGVNPDKISVVYQSCNRVFQEENDCEFTTDLGLKSAKIPTHFALFVGTINKRKNVFGLIKAMSILPKSDRIPLVIVGNGKAKFIQEIRSFLTKKSMENEVVFLGSVPNQELKYLYKNAKFTCLPSFYEGFGIPIIESLFCHTPVLFSNTSSLPEAAGKCGISCFPDKISSISEAFAKFVANDSLSSDYQYFIDRHVTRFRSKNTSLSLQNTYKYLFS